MHSRDRGYPALYETFILFHIMTPIHTYLKLLQTVAPHQSSYILQSRNFQKKLINYLPLKFEEDLICWKRKEKRV